MSERAGLSGEVRARLITALSDSAVGLGVLFGSTAAGRNRHDSDVDIAVLPAASGMDDSAELALVRRLALAARADVDLIRLDKASTLLKWRIATTGVPLYEGRAGEFARFRARAASEYIDFAPSLAHHGEVFRRRLIEQGRAR